MPTGMGMQKQQAEEYGQTLILSSTLVFLLTWHASITDLQHPGHKTGGVHSRETGFYDNKSPKEAYLLRINTSMPSVRLSVVTLTGVLICPSVNWN